MKNRLASIVIILLLLGTAACGSAGTAGFPPETAAAVGIVTFTDPALEQMVRASMGRPEGDITQSEAEAVTRLNLSMEWQQFVSDQAPIQSIGGLERFTNLESLDLSFHAITDVTPLSGMAKLKSLSLRGNPVADIAPLAGLTDLKALLLSGCAARDYGPLAALVNLEFLKLDQSTISDVSPLAALTKLKRLYLAGCPIDDYSPLANVSQNLEEQDFDFKIVSTLAELGFVMDDGNAQASYGDVQRDGLSVKINHAEWGAPQSEDMTKCVRMDFMLDSGYTLVVLYYPEISAYVFQMNINGEQMNYIYNAADGTFMVDFNSRERFERMITEALGETSETDVLLAPIPVFNDTIRKTFGMTADALYALPFLPPTLINFGFDFVTDEQGNASYTYEHHEPHDLHLSIFQSPWGKSQDNRSIEFYDDDVNGFHLLILYYADKDQYAISLQRGDVTCRFERTAAGERSGISPDEDTVRNMFQEAFGSQGESWQDLPLSYFEQVVQKYIGLTISELYALPAGELGGAHPA